MTITFYFCKIAPVHDNYQCVVFSKNTIRTD